MSKPSPQELKRKLDRMYDTSNVEVNYKYWFSRLLNLTLTMFEWDGIPEDATFTGRELELQLQLAGYARIFMKDSKYYCVHTSLYDFDVNYTPTRYVYANPVIGSQNGDISSPLGDIIYNNSLQSKIVDYPIDGSMLSFLNHYARQLADITSTINIHTVNGRDTDFPVAKNDAMKKSLMNFFNKRKMGATEVIYQNDEILDAFANMPKSSRAVGDTLKDLIDAEDRMLEKFYRAVGIKFRQAKAAQINVEETESDEQLLLVFPDDMLKCREKGIDVINEKLGTNITVKLNPKFDRSEYNGYNNNNQSDQFNRVSDRSMHLPG